MYRFVCAALCLCLTGCGGFKEHEKRQDYSEATRAAVDRHVELDRVLEPRETPVVVVEKDAAGKDRVVVSAPPPAERIRYRDDGSANVSGKSREVFYEDDHFPWFIKWIGGGIAIVFLIAIWMFIRKQSVAVGAAFDTGDEVVARYIRRLRDRLEHSEEYKEKQRVKSDIAHLEAERGRLRRSRHAK